MVVPVSSIQVLSHGVQPAILPAFTFCAVACQLMIVSLLLALLPIALLIVLGSWLRQRSFLAAAFWPQAERLGYYILLPALFLHGLATARLDGVPVAAMILTLVCSTLAVSVGVIAVRRLLPVDDAAFTSVFQGGVRFNNYVGVSAAAGLFGAHGVALAAVANAAIVPTVNILCVLVFARYGNAGTPSFKNIVRLLALNPLVVACAIGITLQMTGLGLPLGIEPVMKSLGQASLPLGLLCVGAALDFSAARSWLRPVVMASCAKFVAMPLVTIAACHLFGLSGSAAIAALLFQALPTASSSYIMARQLGGDAPLMAGIIAVQTLVAGVALPLAVLGLSGLL
ncbi:AEC family transporter [Pectobacterium brasiliense]|uniref:AEC family transporter n=1 Tax=Pectobacterium brasiliense TaxID=180957 RepID=UPI001CE09000|nr:AEC family transporter [Pectobacterium brasiliense]MCA5917760.1 AEC family transporter [Pectobacterium brasiliense]MCA5927826.1 AEC family transporter [Pectobacterium brasiliense]MCA5937536.1 AEC family transporter [Pectobacterium brasiliense]MCA5941797.1 AEC family transporter [Pectobacterium brasiliense]MCA5946318.1 AEC family transporter [Pectobacterium brasiliense]